MPAPINKIGAGTKGEEMEYCLGTCSLCDHHGLIHPIKKGDDIVFVCDEAYHMYQCLEDVEKEKFLPKTEIRSDYMSLEDFLSEMPNLKNKVFVLEGNKWYNILDREKKLFP